MIGDYVPERGYRLGEPLEPGEDPWPIGRDRDPVVDDGHAHDWELVTMPAWHGRRAETVVRCATCLVARCGSSSDRDPCMDRRHHRGLHITLGGRFEPVGGIL